ncbi:hypothetical protein ES705_49286 [subsurface metagenome]
MFKTRFRNNNGRFYAYNYLVFENPNSDVKKSPSFTQHRSSPHSGFPCLDKTTLLNIKKKLNNKTPVTTLSNNHNNVNAVQDDPSLEGIKEYTITLLYELGIKEHKFLLDSFYIGDIFEYADWMLTFRSKIKNPGGFLVSAIRGNWLHLPVNS